ncbi:MAG: hypothetical protein ABIO65_09950 [Nitrospiria bacterium]
MRHGRGHVIVWAWVVIALGVFGPARPAISAPTDLIFVVSESAPVQTLSIEDLQKIYLGKKRAVADFPIVAVDHSETEPVKLAFLNTILHLTHAEYRTQLLKRRFQEGAVTPKFVGSSTEALKTVRETPGAIGYVYQADGGSLLGLRVLATVPTQ